MCTNKRTKEGKVNMDLTKKPFYLDCKQITWVEETYQNMGLDEKIGQLICAGVPVLSDEVINDLTQNLKIGSLMFRPLPFQEVREGVTKLQAASKVPMLISANLEYGGCGALAEGTYVAQQMSCAATQDKESAYWLGKISCQEAHAAGINWGYAPVVDIDMSYRNPISNIRTYGNDKDTVLVMAREYIRGAKECGVIPTIKHFPGDGTDERDQHLLVSVNQLSYQEWMESYGSIYENLIEDGAIALMVGHIAQPEVAKVLNPGISDYEAYLPASQSKTLLKMLLREKMNYNGLVVTDSSLMNGFMVRMPRRIALPLTIEYGSDMILFNRNIEEDIRYIKEGYQNGILSEARLEEAVKRVLALKAYLHLPEKKEEGTILPDVDVKRLFESEETKEKVKEIADHSITLVKDTKQVLPLSSEKTKRIYLNVIENKVNDQSEFAQNVKKLFEKEGFEVELRKREMNINPAEAYKEAPSEDFLRIMEEITATTDTFVKKYDACVLVLNMETESNMTTCRVSWNVLAGLGNDFPWYAGEIPLIAISTANPYHLLDIPMAHVYINTYSNNKETLEATMDKICGRSQFKGVSPIDPFCGHGDCRV